MITMINYVEYLDVPVALGLVIIGAFLIMQIVGEVLEFKGKVVPEFVKIRKYFARKKRERQTIDEMFTTLRDVKTVLDSVDSHYNTDNIAKRDAWMKWVNERAEVYDQSIQILKKGLDKNNEITMSLYIESKRSAIINFASYCASPDNPVTREQFTRIFPQLEKKRKKEWKLIRKSRNRPGRWISLKKNSWTGRSAQNII